MITNITQTRFYKHPTPDCRGNCQQAAMASLLGLQLDDVPDFLAEGDYQFWPSVWRYTKSLDLNYSETGDVDQLYGFHHLAYGESPRGCDHAVVYRYGALVWDPHPSREGLTRVKRYALLVPNSLQAHVANVRASLGS